MGFEISVCGVASFPNALQIRLAIRSAGRVIGGLRLGGRGGHQQNRNCDRPEVAGKYARPDHFFVSGAPSVLEPVNILRPSERVTERAVMVAVASFAANPSMVTSSPSFRLFGLHPWRYKIFGGAVSQLQLVTL